MFDSAKQKINRADYHIADFERQANSFYASKPNILQVHRNPQTGIQTLAIWTRHNLPDGIAFVIADAIHNLRVSLDHVAWELAAIGNGAQNRYTKFITGDGRVSFEAACNGVVTPSQWVKDAIRSQEAFPHGRGHDLYDLTELDNDDKHTVIAPALRATSHPAIRIYGGDGGLADTIEGNTFMAGPGAVLPMFHAARECRSEMDENGECPASIFFAKPGGIFEPAWSMLRAFRISAGRTIAEIEAAIP